MPRQPDWNDGNYMDWADQERLVRQDLEEINKKFKEDKHEQHIRIDRPVQRSGEHAL